jgi:transposase-like protein
MKNVITWFLNQVMQQEASNQIKARPYERTDQRRAQRNGIRKRSLKTIQGEVILDKPQFREVPFRTQVFDKYSRVEKSLRIAVAESYLQGVSTRKIQDVVSKFGLENILNSGLFNNHILWLNWDSNTNFLKDCPLSFCDLSQFPGSTDLNSPELA